MAGHRYRTGHPRGATFRIRSSKTDVSAPSCVQTQDSAVRRASQRGSPQREWRDDRSLTYRDVGVTVLCVLRTYLMGGDYEYLQASDGRTGLRTALRDQPDLIVSDVQMPGVDGMELSRVLRAAPGLQSCKLVLISSKWTKERLAEAAKIGVDACLHKPVKPDELAKLVDRLLP